MDDLQKTIAERDAHIEGLSVSMLKIQAELDRQLQLHKDRDVEGAAVVQELTKKYQEELDRKLAEQYRELVRQHAAEIVELKRKHLFPALRDLQARQQADLAAKHLKELEELDA